MSGIGNKYVKTTMRLDLQKRGREDLRIEE